MFHLHASLPACNGFLRFASGVTAVDLLSVSMAAENFNLRSCTRTYLRCTLQVNTTLKRHALSHSWKYIRPLNLISDIIYHLPFTRNPEQSDNHCITRVINKLN